MKPPKVYSEATKSIIVSLVKPSMKYNCLTHLTFTNTQNEKFRRFERESESMTCKSFNVKMENMIHNTKW